MDQITGFILIVVSGSIVALLVGIWLWRQRSIRDVGGSTRSYAEGSGEDFFPVEILTQAQDLVAAGRKIEAIKLIRNHTDWDLRDAKTYIEFMDSKSHVQSGLPELSFSHLGKSVPLGVMTEARALISEGKIIGAVRLVRDHTGWGLKESKEFIDSIR